MNKKDYPHDKNSLLLYKTGALTAVLFFIYSIITILIFTLIGEGYPETATECFEMLNDDKFTALLRLDIVSIIVIPFYYILFFSLYHALKNKNELFAKVAFFSIFAGVTIFISGLNIVEIITLSNKYHATTSPEIRQQLLAAGESMLASDMWISTSAKFRGIMIEFGAVILSILMLHSNSFSRITGIVGLIAHSFDLTSEILSIFIASIKDLFITVAGPLYVLWFILIAIGLSKLSNTKKEKNAVVYNS